MQLVYWWTTPSHSFSIIHTKRVWSLRIYSIFRYGIFLFHARFVFGSLLIAARTLMYLEMSNVQIRRNFCCSSLCMYLCIKSFFHALTLFYLLIYIPFHFIWALFCVIFIWFFFLHFVYNTKSESFMLGGNMMTFIRAMCMCVNVTHIGWCVLNLKKQQLWVSDKN